MCKILAICTISCVLLSSGCAHLPIKFISSEETQVILDDFRSRLSNKYEVLSVVVFKYKFFTISSLGLTSVDLAQDRLSAAGVSPLGVTLFKVVAEKGRITQSFVIPELSKRGDVAKAVAENIRDIYFDLTPGQVISAYNRNGKVYCRTPVQGRSQSEYVFSDKDRTLMEKSLYKDGKLFWRIFYSGWSPDSGGKIQPKKVRLLHRAYKYQLLLNVKEVRPL